MFSANPQEEALIGPASIIVVNDVRHELYPEFLQRTVPYFFTFDKIRRCYKWADVAFVQVDLKLTARTVREMNDAACTVRIKIKIHTPPQRMG